MIWTIAVVAMMIFASMAIAGWIWGWTDDDAS